MLALTAKALLTPVKRIEQPLLLIEGASVVEIRSQREADVPANSRKLDFKDCVLAPGLSLAGSWKIPIPNPVPLTETEEICKVLVPEFVN